MIDTTETQPENEPAHGRVAAWYLQSTADHDTHLGVLETDTGGRPVSETQCIHLLEAHSAELLAECHRSRLYLALGGAELATEDLPSPDCEPGCECEDVYCLECIRAANRRNHELGAHVDYPPGVRVADR